MQGLHYSVCFLLEQLSCISIIFCILCKQYIGVLPALQVYLGSRVGGQKVALKVLSATAHQAATLQRLRRETALLQRVSFDANVVQFYGASLQHAADAVLVMECASSFSH
jgi:serine/threonine protein kinase